MLSAIIAVPLVVAATADPSVHPDDLRVELVVEFSEARVEAARVLINRPEGDAAGIIAVPLPFECHNAANSAATIPRFLGVASSTAVFFFVAGEATAEVNCRFPDPRRDSLATIQTPTGTVLTIPTPAFSPQEKAQLAQFPGVVLVSGFTRVSARIPPGFSLVHRDREVQLLRETEVQLTLAPGGEAHELTFRPPRSKFSEVLDSLFGHLVVVVLALVLTFAAPDFLPAQHASKIWLALVLVVVVLLAVRWSLVLRERTPVMTVVLDSISAGVYLGVAGLVAWMRRSRTRPAPEAGPADKA